MTMKNTHRERESKIDFVSSIFADDSSSKQAKCEGGADHSTHLNFVTFSSCVLQSFRFSPPPPPLVSSVVRLVEDISAFNYLWREDLSRCLCLHENISECVAHSVVLCFAVSHHDLPALFYVNIIAVIYSKLRVTYALVGERRSKEEHCERTE